MIEKIGMPGVSEQATRLFRLLKTKKYNDEELEKLASKIKREEFYELKNILGLSPLHLCASNNNWNGIVYFKELGCNINSLDTRHNSPLHTVLNNDVNEEVCRIVSYLVEKAKCDVNIINKDGLTPLLLAIKKQHFESVKLLVRKEGCNISQGDFNGTTALHLCSKLGNLEIVQLLLDHDANFFAVDDHHNPPLHYALLNGHSKVAEILIDKGALLRDFVDVENNNTLMYSIKGRNIKICKTLITNKISNINQQNATFGLTPLTLSLSFGLSEVSKLILEQEECDSKILDKNKRTPMHYCLDIDIAKTLFYRHKESLSLRDVNFFTPLHINPSLPICQFLLENGADVNMKAKDFQTPLHSHVIAGNKSIVRWLCENKSVLLNVKDRDLNVPLHIAAKEGAMDIMESLLLRRDDVQVNIKDQNGNTPLLLSLIHNKIDCLKILISRNANVNIKNNLGHNALFYAQKIEKESGSFSASLMEALM